MQGTGKIIDRPCQTCKGKGTVQKTRRIEVSVPGAWKTASSSGSPVKGAGREPGTPRRPVCGNPYPADPRFERKGADLYSSVEIGIGTALLGGEVGVPTITGTAHVKIPPEPRPPIFRLREQGMPY